MKQTAVTIEQVNAAIAQLRERGERVSRKNVLNITGGSMSTIHRLMGEIEETEARAAAAPLTEGIDERVQGALLNWIHGRVDDATGALEAKIVRLQGRETEALEALGGAETRIEALTDELAAAQAQADQDRQAAKEAAAVAAKEIEGLGKTVEALQIERKQLIEAGAAARTEAAKAELQVDRADAAAEKAETELQALRERLPVAEKAAAVAEQRAVDLETALVKSETRIQELENRIDEIRKMNTELEKSLALASAGKKTEAKAVPSAGKKEKTRSAATRS